ncbi:hypothetical protein BGX28_004074 [Mortierella sp. GBA30]|nr:hypothetical protein BGX28_004074 [Mortierella sp. GBA30]
MPITIYPSTMPLEAISNQYPVAQNASYYASNPFAIVEFNEYLQQKKGQVFQSSFPMPSKGSFESDMILPAKNYNGFVDTFNLYVNANAETLRHHFVTHSGKKELKAKAVGDRYTVHFGDLAEQMSGLIQENVVDPNLQKWILPDFTTTTADDIIISSAIMMSTLKKYFDYNYEFSCGLPAVTLLGERSDWEKLVLRVEKLSDYGEATTTWRNLLQPVLTGFVKTFSDPDGQETKNFWQTIAHYTDEGCGTRYLSGWITSFLFFDEHGKSLYETTDDWIEQQLYRLGNATFHLVKTSDIPAASADVPVLLNDNDEKIKIVMIAGLLGTRVSGKNHRVQPQAAWWIAEDPSQKD